MKSNPVINFRNMDSSPAVRRKIEEKLVLLEKHFPHLEGATVTVSRPQKRKVSGTGFEVRIKLVVPGPDQLASKHFDHGETAENLDLALHAAFDAAMRRLNEHVDKMKQPRSDPHPPIEHGFVHRLFEGEGYGFIRCPEDGAEYYFSREALTSDVWDDLKVDTRVRFRAEDGENGPYAANVTLLKE